MSLDQYSRTYIQLEGMSQDHYSKTYIHLQIAIISSVVTRWIVDQEVVGSNPIHGRNKNFCHPPALPVYTAYSIK